MKALKYNEYLSEREYNAEEREKLADTGSALPDGSFPIVDMVDLENAIQAYGRAKDQSKAAKHIAKRAKDLGLEDMIPTTDDFQKSLKESVGLVLTHDQFLTEAKSDFQVYHNTYSSAVDAALEYARSRGYEVVEDDVWDQISVGPAKPKDGVTNRASIGLTKDGKPQRKMLQIQIYGMGNKYELNAYIN